MTSRRAFITMAGALTLSVMSPLPGGAAQQGTLRVVPQSDLKILDPIWTTAFVTRNHGYAIYDTLFGVDAGGNIRPQMVADHSHSEDGKVWRFRLRKGLKFHDGAAVTSADVIQSLKRWAQRDNLGQKLFASVKSIDAESDDSFSITLAAPFGLMLEALSKPASVPPFIMPRKVAETPGDQQITSTVGSGPFIFKSDEYRPGERVVYVKNADYVPRDEPASGTAGGKVVNVDRMEWVILSDGQTQTNAIVNGEVDLIEWVPADQYSALKSNSKIGFANLVPKGSFALHLNHLVPPFNNVKIARAALMAVSQDALMRAQMVHPELYNVNPSIYPTGTPYNSEKTSYYTGKPQFARAKELLKEAGYKNEPVVLLYPSSFAVLNKFPPVLAALLKQAGFNVDLQSMDWPTLVARRAQKMPTSQGGWSAFITGWNLPDNINPMFYAPITGNGENGWFGWPTDEPLEKLKNDFLQAVSDDDRKDLAAQIQERVFDAAILGPIGEYKQLTAIRTEAVDGIVTSPVGVFWGIRKN